MPRWNLPPTQLYWSTDEESETEPRASFLEAYSCLNITGALGHSAGMNDAAFFLQAIQELISIVRELYNRDRSSLLKKEREIVERDVGIAIRSIDW